MSDLTNERPRHPMPHGEEPHDGSNADARARLTRAVSKVTEALGSFSAMATAACVIVVWLITGPIFGFSDTWQLIINTGTTIVTFCMVFIIQNTQNRDGRAIQTKLDEIIEALASADDGLVGIEELPDQSIKVAQRRVRRDASPVRAGGA